MSKIEVKAIPSSFVAKNMKLYSDTGAGEAKLFVGSTRNTKEFNEFFEFESDYKYCFSKENLLQYLDQMKLEYGFQKINRYKNVSLETWEENYNNISSMNADESTKLCFVKNFCRSAESSSQTELFSRPMVG